MALSNVGNVTSALSNVVTYDNLIHAAAGSTGAVVAMSLVYPLDIARTRLQADDTLNAMGTAEILKKIADEGGIQSLYRGLGPVLTSLCCSNFVYFYSFNGMKYASDGCGFKASPMRDLVFGYLSGCINAMATTPLWVANTRLKLQKNKKNKDTDGEQKHLDGLIDGLRTIAKQEGVPALWHGVSTSFILSSNPAIHFMVYETLKRQFLKGRPSQTLTSIESFILGGFAKCVATVITYPLQLVQCRQRGRKGDSVKNSMTAVLQEIVRNSGLLGLYKGMETKLYQTVFAAAVMFLTYEKVVLFVHQVFKVKK